MKDLWGDARGFAELRTISPDRHAASEFFPYPSKLDEFLRRGKELSGRSNVYFGVCLRSRRSGTAADVLSVPALWCDLDFKTSDEATCRKRLSEFPLKPSTIIETGGGLHLYWIMKEPILGANPQKIRFLNQGIASWLGGDPNACDIARILRLPGTENLKYNPPRAVKLFATTGARYNLMDFDFLPRAEESPPTTPATDTAGVILEGSRNSALMSLAGTLRRRGLSHSEITPILGIVNRQRCRPPLDDSEIVGIAHNVERYQPSAPINGTHQPEEPATPEPEDVKVADGYSAVDIMAKELPPIDYIIEPIMSIGNLSLIQGEPKGGKSSFALYCAVSAAIGLWTSSRFCVPRPRRTLFMTWEDGLRRAKTRLVQYLGGLGCGAPENLTLYVHQNCPTIRLETPVGRLILRKVIEKYAAEFVILDTLSHLSGCDENSKKEMQPVMDALKDTARDMNCGILTLHHTGKPGMQEKKSTVYKGRGSSVIAAAPDVILDWGCRGNTNVTPCNIIGKDDDSDCFSVVYTKDDDEHVRWAIEDAEVTGSKAQNTEKVITTLAELQKGFPEGVGQRALVKACGLAQNTVKVHLFELMAKGKVRWKLKGQSKVWLGVNDGN